MRKSLRVLLVLGLGVGLSGCAAAMSPVTGMLYMNVQGPVAATGEAASREGTACTKTILGLFATGDASIAAASQAGGIKKVSTVDHRSKNILGIYAQFCTIVRGS